MRENLNFRDGKGMLRWLLLALLLTSIVSQNFAEPKSVYRIEEVISGAKNETFSGKIGKFTQSFQTPAKTSVPSNKYRLQYERLRFLSKTLHFNIALAISNAPKLLPMLMHATGYYLKRRSQSSENQFHS